MSNPNEQNGRLPNTAEQAGPPTDPRLRNMPVDEQRICRDYIWGICLMGEHCKYRHELEFEAMKSVLRFCHNFQNRTGCTRPDCTYLHTSREEQNLFITTGQIPRVLAERYAANALPMGSVNDAMLMPPPPPPPPSARRAPPPPPVAGPSSMAPGISGQHSTSQLPVGQLTMSGSMIGPMNAPMNGSMSTVMTAPMTSHTIAGALNGAMTAPMSSAMPAGMVSVHGQMHAQMPVQNGIMTPSMSSLMAPPPPPPPPPPPATSAPTRLNQPIYPTQATQQLHQAGPSVYSQAANNLSHVLPQLPAMFDPTRPPPPLPTAAQVYPTKRAMQSEQIVEAGTCKMRKVDNCNDGVCENCIQTQLRIDFYQQEMEKLQREEEYNQSLYAKKTEDYENGIRLLNTLFNSDVIQLLLENDLHPGSSSAMLNDNYYPSPGPSTSSYNADGQSSVSRNLLIQLMNAVANSYAPPRNVNEHPPPVEPRRPPPPTAPSQNNDVFAILDWLKNTLVDNRAPTADMNGVNRYAAEPLPGPSRYVPYAEPERAAPRYSLNYVEPERAPRYPPAPYEPEPVQPRYPPEPVQPRYPPVAAAYVEPEPMPGPSRYPAAYVEPTPPAPVSVQYQARPYLAPQYPAPSTSQYRRDSMAPPIPEQRQTHEANAQELVADASPSSPLYVNAGASTSRADPADATPQPGANLYSQYRLPHHYYPPYQ